MSLGSKRQHTGVGLDAAIGVDSNESHATESDPSAGFGGFRSW